MPYFFTHDNLKLGKEIIIQGEEARHILLSHRIKLGEQIKLQGPDGKRYKAEIKEINRNSLKCLVLEALAVPQEPSMAIVLFQSVVSEKALDFIFQKGTELGLSKIILFNSTNTATKLSREQFGRKQLRWDKILIEAAKQSERGKWPELLFVLDINQAVEKMRSLGKILLADPSGDKLLPLDPVPSTLGLVIGPEGGFTNQEIEIFKGLPNLQPISLGPILLRAETAALAALSICRNY
jgi:16S rRNA (uracil1498-N3)-methyltransferase